MWDLVVSSSEGEVRVLLDETRLARQLVDTASRVASEQLVGMPDAVLAQRVLILEQAANKLDAARAAAQAALDARCFPDESEGMRTGAWIAREPRTPTADAKRRVTVSRRLIDEYPTLWAALAKGKVS